MPRPSRCRRLAGRLASIVVVAASLAAGCGDDDAASSTPREPAAAAEPTDQPDEPSAPTPTPQPGETPEPTSAPPTATPEPPPPTVEQEPDGIAIVYSGGAVEVPDDRIEIDRGETVTLVAVSDVAEELHVHGYDLHLDLVPGVGDTLSFVADIPGVFEVELEHSATFVLELEVS